MKRSEAETVINKIINNTLYCVEYQEQGGPSLPTMILNALEDNGMSPPDRYWFPETTKEVIDVLKESIYPPQNICDYIIKLNKNHPDFKSLFWALNNAVRKTSSMWKQSNVEKLEFVLTNPWEPEDE